MPLLKQFFPLAIFLVIPVYSGKCNIPETKRGQVVVSSYKYLFEFFTSAEIFSMM